MAHGEREEGTRRGNTERRGIGFEQHGIPLDCKRGPHVLQVQVVGMWGEISGAQARRMGGHEPLPLGKQAKHGLYVVDVSDEVHHT